MSMCMPGRRSYEAVVVRVRQSGHAAMDVDVDKALEMLRQPALYKEYVAQLGTVLVISHTMCIACLQKKKCYFSCLMRELVIRIGRRRSSQTACLGRRGARRYQSSSSR